VDGLVFHAETGSLISTSRDSVIHWNLLKLHSAPLDSESGLEWQAVEEIVPWPAKKGFVMSQRIGSALVTAENVINHQAVTGVTVDATGKLTRQFSFLIATEDESNSVWCLAMHPTEPILATGHHGSQICLWNISGDQLVLLTKWIAHRSHVCDVAFSPDGTQIASAGWDHETKLWKITPGEARDGVKPPGTAIGTHADIVRSVAWSQDGRHLASGGEDGQILLWNLEGGDAGHPQSLMNPEDGAPAKNSLSPGTVGSLEFAKSGSQLLSADGLGRVCIWSVPSGTQMKKWQLPGWVWQACFSPDESTIATANNDGTIYILRSPIAEEATAR